MYKNIQKFLKSISLGRKMYNTGIKCSENPANAKPSRTQQLEKDFKQQNNM